MGRVLDFLSVYDTPRYTRITSRRLGLLWWLLALLVVVYSCFSVFVFRSFRSLEPLDSFVDVAVKSSEFDTASCEGKREPCRVLTSSESVAYKEMKAVAIALFEKRNHSKTRLESAPMFKLEYAVFGHGQDSDFYANGRSMKGAIVGKGSKMIRELHKGHSDHISLKEMLLAAGIESLDAPSDVPGEQDSSLRERGFHLVVDIFYSDNDEQEPFWRNLWGRKEQSYEIRVRHIQKSQHKIEYGDQGDATYCCLLHFKSNGERVVFAGVPAVLTQLAHGISLITVGSVFLDILAVYVLKEKRVIYPEKFAEPKAKIE